MNVAPPGWYRDPSGSGTERWWDGQVWTPQFRMPQSKSNNNGLKALAWIVGILLALSLGLGILKAIGQAEYNNCMNHATTLDQMSKC